MVRDIRAKVYSKQRVPDGNVMVTHCNGGQFLKIKRVEEERMREITGGRMTPRGEKRVLGREKGDT